MTITEDKMVKVAENYWYSPAQNIYYEAYRDKEGRWKIRHAKGRMPSMPSR